MCARHTIITIYLLLACQCGLGAIIGQSTRYNTPTQSSAIRKPAAALPTPRAPLASDKKNKKKRVTQTGVGLKDPNCAVETPEQNGRTPYSVTSCRVLEETTWQNAVQYHIVSG